MQTRQRAHPSKLPAVSELVRGDRGPFVVSSRSVAGALPIREHFGVRRGVAHAACEYLDREDIGRKLAACATPRCTPNICRHSSLRFERYPQRTFNRTSKENRDV